MIKTFKTKGNEYLSNFAKVVVKLDGVEYPSVEHAYMSAKSEDPTWKLFCQNKTRSPGLIKKMSRKQKLVPDWDSKKLSIMEDLVRQKFNKEPFKSKLLNTGNENIQEGNTWNDKFWGICLKTGDGENHLGRLIMKIRDELSQVNE